MCGIAGFLSTNLTFSTLVKAMTDVISYRGPDDEGHVWLSGAGDVPRADNPPEKSYLALGHRRLSIVDLSPLGHQPMSYDDGRYWIVYNGEIYNHIELRSELEEMGYDFMSHSDTEIILAAYDAWGPECLPRFNGMWAVALYDHQKQSLFLARDRFGVKPLYYWLSPQGDLFFGSEIKQFTVLPDWSPALNKMRAAEYLGWGIADHTDETFFDGVYQLPPSHYALIKTQDAAFHSGGRIATSRWYQLQPAPFSGSYEQAVQSFNSLLNDSIRLRLRSDVAVGSCLSGGLDSSSIVCLANGLMKESGAESLQKTFSAYSTSEKLDERKWVEVVTDHCKVDAFSTYPDLDQLSNALRDLVWHQDEPFGSASIYAQWCVFKMAAEQKVRVMLDGQGADEYLAGYRAFQWAYLADLLKRGQMKTLFAEARAFRKVHGYSLARMTFGVAASFFPSLRKPPSWLSSRVRNPEAGFARNIDSLSLSQLTATNLCMLLHWEDRSSMAHSVESRVPFLDYRLVEFSLGVPDEFKIYQGLTKRILRDSMAEILPERTRIRTDKIGFAAAEEDWLRGAGSVLARQGVHLAIKHSAGMISERAHVRVERFLAGKEPFGQDIWRLICFGFWADTFSVKPPTSV